MKNRLATRILLCCVVGLVVGPPCQAQQVVARRFAHVPRPAESERIVPASVDESGRRPSVSVPTAQPIPVSARPGVPIGPPAKPTRFVVPEHLGPSRIGARLWLQTEERSAWRYPAIGLGVGALAGVVWGTYVMATADEYLAPPAHIVTVPIGAVVGGLIGLLANGLSESHESGS